MTSEELEFMLDYADISIEKVFLCEGYGPAPITIPNWGNMPNHSFAFGLYMENLWTSLTRSLDGKLARSPLSAWLHTYDRLACLKKSIEIDQEFNVAVHSYGYGRITLMVPENSSALLSKIAITKKMITPMANKNSRIIYKADTKGGPASIMQAAMDRRAIDFVIQINERAVGDAMDAKRRQLKASNSSRITL